MHWLWQIWQRNRGPLGMWTARAVKALPFLTFFWLASAVTMWLLPHAGNSRLWLVIPAGLTLWLWLSISRKR